MSNLRIANRYAAILLEITEEKKTSKVKDVEMLNDVLKTSRDFVNMLKSPIINKEKKKSIITEIFQKKIDKQILNYLLFIIEKRREIVLDEILHQYFILRDEQLGIQQVTVTTSVEFSSKQEKELEKKLEEMTNKKIQLHYVIDPSLKAGFIARVGDTVLDGSLKHQLELVRNQLKNTVVLN